MLGGGAYADGLCERANGKREKLEGQRHFSELVCLLVALLLSSFLTMRMQDHYHWNADASNVEPTRIGPISGILDGAPAYRD